MENGLFGLEVGCDIFEATHWDRGSINLIQPVNIKNVIWERQSTVSANLFSTVIFGIDCKKKSQVTAVEKRRRGGR